MHSKALNKAISILITIIFLLTNTNIGYGAPSSRSLFKNKKVDYDKITNERQDTLQKQQSIIKGDDAKELEAQDKASKKILQANLSDISQIHIPQEIGRVVEVYQAPNSETQAQSPLIVGIQDLHTNPEAELNLAKTLEILLKDYKMGLVCSEGADGVVDTSSISSFPDANIKEKVSRIFIDSGELTGEEYLSITKYPDLPIWGVEDKDIYFKNILDFNKIMKFNPNSQVFISQTKKAVEELKPRIYSKELIELDKKEFEFSSQKLDTAIYTAYLTDYAKKFNLNTSNYKNIALLNDTTKMEKTINQSKIMSESSNLILYLQSVLMNKNLKADLDTLMARAKLFNDQKSSPFSFYSYLKNLALKHMKEDFAAKYPELNNFIGYLTKVNSLDSTKLFLELENLNFEIKETIAKTDEQKLLIKASRNINFLESFFNLKVSNEDLDYYVNHRDEHKVAFFKDFLSPIIKKYNINAFIDYNPALIDSHFQELEEFYKVVKDRDIAMVKNSLSEIEKRNVKLASLVHGGFHTKGITKLLREKGYSYIIVSPYSKTDINEENYHFLLQGRRKPITELLQKLDLSKIIDSLLKPAPETLRVALGFNPNVQKAYEAMIPKLAQELGVSEDLLKSESLINRMNQLIGVEALANNKATSIEAKVLEQEVILKFVLEDGTPKYIKLTKKENIIDAQEALYNEFNAGRAIESVVTAAKAPTATAASERTGDQGVMTGVQHMGTRQFIERNDLRNPDRRKEDLEKLFQKVTHVGLPECIHIQGAPAGLKMGEKTGFGGHYTLRRHSSGYTEDADKAANPEDMYYYIYIDEARLEGKTDKEKYLIVAEEVYEFLKAQYSWVFIYGGTNITNILNFSNIKENNGTPEDQDRELAELLNWFNGVSQKTELAEDIADGMVKWIARADSSIVREMLQHFHDLAPKLPGERAVPPTIPAELADLIELFNYLASMMRGIVIDVAKVKIGVNGAVTFSTEDGGLSHEANINIGILKSATVLSLFSDIFGKKEKQWELDISLKGLRDEAGKIKAIQTALLKAAGWDRSERGAAAAGASTPSQQAMRDARIIAIDFAGTLDTNLAENVELIRQLLEADSNLIVLIVSGSNIFYDIEKTVADKIKELEDTGRLKISGQTVNKGREVQSIASQNSIDSKYIIAIGDSHDDSSMALDQGSFIDVGSKTEAFAFDVLTKILEAKITSASLSTASTDVPAGRSDLTFIVEQSQVDGLQQASIEHATIRDFLNSMLNFTAMPPLGQGEFADFMQQIFNTGGSTINDFAKDERGVPYRTQLLQRLSYLLNGEVAADKPSFTFYLAHVDLMGKAQARKVKIKGKDGYAIFISQDYYDAIIEAKKIIVQDNALDGTGKRQAIAALNYTVFERVMHEVLEPTENIENYLKGHSESNIIPSNIVIATENIAFMTDGLLYGALCYGKSMAGYIKLAKKILLDANKIDLASKIFGPNRYGKLEEILKIAKREGFGIVRKDGLVTEPSELETLAYHMAPEFVDVTYADANTTAIVDKSGLPLSTKVREELKVDSAFVIRASKMMTPEEKLNQMSWLAEKQDSHLLVLVSTLEEYKAVEDIKDEDRVHLVVLIGGNGLETHEAALAAGIDAKYLYNLTPELQLLFTNANIFDAPTSISKVVEGNRAAAETIVQQI